MYTSVEGALSRRPEPTPYSRRQGALLRARTPGQGHTISAMAVVVDAPRAPERLRFTRTDGRSGRSPVIVSITSAHPAAARYEAAPQDPVGHLGVWGGVQRSAMLMPPQTTRRGCGK